MNLNPIIATTQRAFMSVPFQRGAAGGLPVAMVRGHLPAAPKLAPLPGAQFRFPFGAAFGAATCLLATDTTFKGSATDNAGASFPVGSTPTRREVAIHRTVTSVEFVRRNVKRSLAVVAGFICTITWAVGGQSGRTFAPCGHKSSSVKGIIPQVWREAAYFAIAERRIAAAQPPLFAAAD